MPNWVTHRNRLVSGDPVSPAKLCQEKIEGVTRLDRVWNEDIRRRLGVEAVLAVADRKKEWRERIEGISKERLVRRVFEEDVCRRIPRGQPRKKWIDDISHT